MQKIARFHLHTRNEAILHDDHTTGHIGGRPRLGSPLFDSVVQAGIIACLTVAFLGGKFSFTRFVDETAANHWFELRLWLTTAALAGIALQAMLLAPRLDLSRTQSLWIPVSVALLHAVFLIHLVLLGNPPDRLGHAIDFAYVITHACLFAYVVRSREDVLTLVYVVESIGLILFATSIGGVHNQDLYGPGWAPFGTPLTFYRVEYLTFCSALYAMTTVKSNVIRLLHLAIASIGLISTLGSASKGALVVSIAVAIYLFIAFSIVSQLRRAFLVLGIQVVVLSVFAIGFNDQLTSRWHVMDALTSSSGDASGKLAPPTNKLQPTIPEVSAGKTQPGPANEAQPSPSPHLPETSPSNRRDQSAEPPQPGLSSTSPSVPSPETRSDGLDSDVVLIADRTHRIRLWLHAVRLFQENKLVGGGFGNFTLQLPDLGSPIPNKTDIYRYPHNIVLELLVSTGAIGTTLFVLTLIIVIIIVHRAAGLDDRWLFMVAYLLFILLSANFAGDIYDFRGFWFIGIVIANVAWLQSDGSIQSM